MYYLDCLDHIFIFKKCLDVRLNQILCRFRLLSRFCNDYARMVWFTMIIITTFLMGLINLLIFRKIHHANSYLLIAYYHFLFSF